MKIFIVSGFLGAGKTTFIKEMINRCNGQLVVLENEYGQNSLDSSEIKNSSDQDLKLIEFMEGCVCCTQKDTFSNTILAISAGLDPEYLIVEPTGVGKLSNIMLAIEKVSYEKIKILPPVVVICPESYDENIRLYGDICRDQVANASKVIFSKTEHSSPDLINYVREKVLEINPTAEIVTEHYTTRDKEWFENLLYFDGEPRTIVQNEDEANAQMDQLTLKDVKLDNLGEFIIFLEDVLHYDFGLIPRAKGVIQISDFKVRFDVADGLYAVIEEDSNTSNECVFIGKYIDRSGISARLRTEYKIGFKKSGYKKILKKQSFMTNKNYSEKTD